MYASVFYIWMFRGGGVANKGNPGEEKVSGRREAACRYRLTGVG
jgi:hypothetical protein